jgi:hypothetical protein
VTGTLASSTSFFKIAGPSGVASIPCPTYKIGLLALFSASAHLMIFSRVALEVNSEFSDRFGIGGEICGSRLKIAAVTSLGKSTRTGPGLPDFAI